MSVSGVKDKEVTAVIVTAAIKSMFPPLLGTLGAPCNSPICCTVRIGLIPTDVTAALGTIQILVGLFNIGLGSGRTSTRPGDLTDLRAAYWLGAVYIIAGIVSFISGRFPSACWIGFTAFVNIISAIFSIVGVALYVIDLGDAFLAWLCNLNWHSVDNYDEKCVYLAYFAQSLLTGMDITLIVLAVLQLCVCISLAVLCIRALVSREKEEFQHVEGDFPQLMVKEVKTRPGA